MENIQFRTISIKTLNYSLTIPPEFEFDKHKEQLIGNGIYTFLLLPQNGRILITVENIIQWNSKVQQNQVFKLQVESVFYLADFDEIYNKETNNIPKEALKLLMIVAVSHARGIQSIYTNNTPLERTLIAHNDIDPDEFQEIK